MILVDYACHHCGHRWERLVRRPAPDISECARCSGASRRMISAAGLIGKAVAASDTTTAHRNTSTPACRTNPLIPGLCHIDPSAAPALIARATGDNRTLDRELARQEKTYKENPAAIVDPIGGHGHGHGHAATSTTPAGDSTNREQS